MERKPRINRATQPHQEEEVVTNKQPKSNPVAKLWTNVKTDCTHFSFSRFLRMAIIIAILLNVATYFWPALPTKIPMIYNFFQFFLDIGEVMLKLLLGIIPSIFKWNMLEFLQSAGNEIIEILKAFWTMVSTIRF